jgi:very-short-patch-repair endonuclease
MSSYEYKIATILNQSKIKFQKEKTFSDLKHGLFRFDFYIQGANCIIEVDGEQHFKPIYGRQSFLKGQEHDRRKNSYCLANGIKLYRIPYWEIKNLKTSKDIFVDKFLVKTRWHNDHLTVPH